MITRRTRTIATVAALLLLGALLYAASRRIDLPRVAAELRHVGAGWVLLALACYVTILPLWALQWRILAPQVPRNTFARMLGLIAVTSTTHNTTFLFVGDATGALLLGTRIGLAKPEVASVIAMDQLLVGIAKIGVLAAAAASLTIPAWMNNGIATLAVGVVALFVGTVLGAWHYEAIAARAERLLPARAARALHGMGVALSPLRSPQRFGSSLALAFLKKLAEIAAILCVQHAFGIDLPVASAILVLAAINMATLLPLVPGNLGVYEAAIALIYVRLGVPTELAVGAAVVQHAAYFVALALPGYAWLSAAGLSTSAAAAS